ncbi:MAG TPA: NYN domain-containing protein [Thermohalobaculum sp.]|nr:NYN domain-containing protein [Thermohalobaculum sp.]
MPAPRPASLAVLIDADNNSARYAHAIFEEIAKFGEANVRRIYGDFSGERLKAWHEVMQTLAIVPAQQFNYTSGKNAADITLVIDAMDLMHRGHLDGFCIVSSDSDFTRLASRLREEGAVVYGFGAKRTPEALRNACSRFIYIENLRETDGSGDSRPAQDTGGGAVKPAQPAPKEKPKEAIPVMLKAMEEAEDADGWVHLGGVGSRILVIAPDFDPRTYGCANLSTLAEKSGGFEIRKGAGNAVHIRAKKPAKTRVTNAKKK